MISVQPGSGLAGKSANVSKASLFTGLTPVCELNGVFPENGVFPTAAGFQLRLEELEHASDALRRVYFNCLLFE